MTRPRPRPSLLFLGVPGLLLGCGTTGTGAAARADAPLTARALAGVAAEYIGDPSSARPENKVYGFSKLVVATELRYGATGEYDGDALTVAVGSATNDDLAGCDRVADLPVDGCAETDDGTVFWQLEEPEEDPGVVFVTAVKGGTTVAVSQSSTPVTGDPRTLDLRIPVQTMLDLANDPRVDLKTTSEAVQAGNDLDVWRDR